MSTYVKSLYIATFIVVIVAGVSVTAHARWHEPPQTARGVAAEDALRSK